MIDLDAPLTRAAVFWATWICLMTMDVFLPPELVAGPAYLVGTGFAWLVALVWWFLADSRSLNLKPSWGLRIAVVFLPPLAIPYYRFRYAGFANGLRFTALVLIVFAALFALTSVFLESARKLP